MTKSNDKLSESMDELNAFSKHIMLGTAAIFALLTPLLKVDLNIFFRASVLLTLVMISLSIIEGYFSITSITEKKLDPTKNVYNFNQDVKPIQKRVARQLLFAVLSIVMIVTIYAFAIPFSGFSQPKSTVLLLCPEGNSTICMEQKANLLLKIEQLGALDRQSAALRLRIVGK